MENELIYYSQALQAETVQPELIDAAFECLLSKNIDSLSLNRQTVSELFYQILKNCKRIYEEETVEEVGEKVLELFNHIGKINTDIDTRSSDSNLITIWFLNILYTNATIEDEDFEVYIEDIIKGLNDIDFIFDIKKSDGSRVFPIDKLISKVISDVKFKEMKTITPYHIRMLKLAVKIFDDKDDCQILESLKTKCNLKFLNYMDSSSEIIDTKDFLNYKKNGVMIFHNFTNKSILIRHEKESYFGLKEPIKGVKIEKELNSKKDIIGFFVIINIDPDFEIVDIKSVISENPTKVLELICNQNLYNIFHKKALLKINNEYWPINPYTVNDSYIIEGINSKGKPFIKEKICEVINRYGMVMIHSNSINNVTLGLCLNLLHKENIGIDSLKLDSCSHDDWLQNQIVYNWVNSTKDPIDSISFILNKWYKELNYCSGSIESYDIINVDMLPYASNLHWIYQTLGIPEDKYSIYYGTIEHDDDSRPYLSIANNRTMAGKATPINTEFSIAELHIEDVLSKSDFDDYCTLGKEHYVVYDTVNGKFCGKVEHEQIYRLLSQIERFSISKSLPIELNSIANADCLNVFKERILLQKQALMLEDASNDLFFNFDTMVIYRLIHNMIYCKVTAENWRSYFNVIMNHQMLDFSGIKNDEHFSRTHANILYVPKDGTYSDGTLSRVFNECLISSGRENYNIYSPNISKDDNGQYMINGNVIDKVVFLFDNICKGTSTTEILTFYLNKESVFESSWLPKKIEAYKKARQKYMVDNMVVSVFDIISTNKIVDIGVHSFYGTDVGKVSIEEKLAEYGFPDATVTYSSQITSWYSNIKEDAEVIWPQMKSDDDFCVFIRKYNQPKKNVFPREMISDPMRAITLFVVKDELRW